MSEFPREWSAVKSEAARSLDERAPELAPTWLDRAGGFGTGWSYRRNREMLDRLAFQMHLLHSAGEPVLETSVLGQRLRLPVMIAPMSETVNPVSGPETLSLLGRGAYLAGTAASIGHPVHEASMVAMAAEGAPIFRAIKPLRDRALLLQAIRESERAGCFAIAIDVDAQLGLNPAGDVPKYVELVRPLSAGELQALRQETQLPFVLKGIMSVRDARAAVDIGADAIVVSNHGGHAFDYCLSSIEVLPEIVAAVGDQVEVWFDSGVRRGTDVLKALALGARVALIGRLAIWGLALGGADGVAHILSLMATEMRRTMLMIGAGNLGELRPEMVVEAG